jgi:hypothetical protein
MPPSPPFNLFFVPSTAHSGLTAVADTIITSFPKRWGRHCPDPTSVQECILNRLKRGQSDKVRCVFDLAIIVMDQCSKVFFDHTLPPTLQPALTDIFAYAIGTIVRILPINPGHLHFSNPEKSKRQTIALKLFWQYTDLRTHYFQEDIPMTRWMKRNQQTLLDMRVEGSLLNEIQDIIDELFIITQIKLQQQNVARSFVKCIKHVLEPEPAADRAMKNSSASIFQCGHMSNSQVEQNRSDISYWTMRTAMEYLDNIADQISELENLTKIAHNTSNAVSLS